MLGLVEAQVTQVTHALLSRDVTAAHRIAQADREVNRLYERVDAQCLEIIAMHAPMIGDLRALMSVLRMTAHVERAGDLVLTLAKVVHRTSAYDVPDAVGGLIQGLGGQAAGLLRAATRALQDREPETAERLDLVDDVLDELADQMADALATSPPVPMALAMQMAVAARCYERIGDHAVAVSERVEFLVTGAAHRAHVGL